MALGIVAIVMSSFSVPTFAAQEDVSEWKMVFHDEFDQDTINENYWNKYPAAIDEEGYFFYGNTPETVVCPENVSVKDGYLHILAEKNPIDLGDGIEHTYRTGILQSREKMELTYGRFEARIKMPDLPGSNPAFWLMPHKYEDGFSFIGLENSKGEEGYGAEIDILEHIYTDGNAYQTTVHWGGYGENHKSWTVSPKPRMEGNPFDWHIFALEWIPTSLTFLVDGKNVAAYSGTAIPKGAEFIILSLGMGGNWIGTPDESKMPAEMLVDYVRVYQKDSYVESELPDGTYTIQSVFSGKYLDISSEEGKHGVVQMTGNGQKIINKNSGLALDIANRWTSDNAPIIQWKDTGRDNQQWIFTPVNMISR